MLLSFLQSIDRGSFTSSRHVTSRLILLHQSHSGQAMRYMNIFRFFQTMPMGVHKVDVATKKARFAMACFWAPDSLFGATLGVVATRVGYSGGKYDQPTYRNLGDHTEAIEIDYDPKAISYEKLLELFWANHDPTSRCKRQYTSLIFYFDGEQKAVAEQSLKEQQKNYNESIVTEIIPAAKFYDAEDYHQKYRLQNHPWLCKAVGLDKSGPLLKSSFLAARLNGYVIGQGGVAQFESDLPSLGLDEKVAEYVRRQVTKFEGHGLVC